MMNKTEYHMAMVDIITSAWSTPEQPDYTDFSWWSDEELDNFVKSVSVLSLDEDTYDSLKLEIDKRGTDGRIPHD
jgi:hypothetical protein